MRYARPAMVLIAIVALGASRRGAAEPLAEGITAAHAGDETSLNPSDAYVQLRTNAPGEGRSGLTSTVVLPRPNPNPPSTLRDGLLLVAVGFVLTTVVGGVLGSFLQTRLWRYQWEVQTNSKLIDAARSVFEEVSRLMDRRLFRLTQLQLWTIRKDEYRMSIAITDYREVMREWNDSINRNLSLLQFYFGTEVRSQFDFGVGKKFVDVGSLAERLYRSAPDVDEKLGKEVASGIAELRADVYEYNLSLLDCMDRLQQLGRPQFFSTVGRRSRGSPRP